MVTRQTTPAINNKHNAILVGVRFQCGHNQSSRMSVYE